MVEMNDEELERRLKAIRLETSPGLDARVMGLGMQPAPRSRRRRFAGAARLAVAAAAVCAVVVLAWWLLSSSEVMPSAYAQLMEAVENSKGAEWAHLRGEIAGQELEAWISFRPLRQVLRSGLLVVYWDSASRSFTAYDPATRTLRVQEDADIAASMSKELAEVSSLFEAVMKQIERAREEGAEIAEEAQVVNGIPCTLFVIRDGKGTENRIAVDRLARRVIRVEMAVADGNVSGALDIDYPETGPADIYALGVPRDARVVDVSPPEAFNDLEGKVEAAREAFAPVYYGIVCEARVVEEGRYRPTAVTAVYKKGGRYRTERYRTRGDAPGVEDLQQRMSDGGMAALEAWVRAKPPEQVILYEGHWQTTVLLDEAGQLKKQKMRVGASNLKLRRLIEREAWGQPAAGITTLPLTVAVTTAMLPTKDGPLGRLVGVEHAVQGLRMGKRVTFRPVRRRQHFNPARDYVCELSESVEGAHPDWQEGQDWMEALPPDTPNRDFQYRQARKVLEYAQTADGQWYARKILVEDDFSPRASSRRTILIHLDTEREIPDELFDPDSVTAELFQAPQGQSAPE